MPTIRRDRRRLRLGAFAGASAAALAAASFAVAALTSSSSSSHTVASGSLTLTDNDNGSALIAITNGVPGQSSGTSTGCIKVTYTGSVSANLRLYATVTGTLAPYLTLTVTRGTDSAPSYKSCTNFSADSTNYIGSGAGVISSGLLSAFPTSYAAGLVDPTSGSPETWTQNETHSYKFVITLNNDSNAQALSSTTTFTWEARNLTGSK